MAQEFWLGQPVFRVTEDRGDGWGEGHPGDNELTPSPHVDQRYRLAPSIRAMQPPSST